jgi:hypothetical protein
MAEKMKNGASDEEPPINTTKANAEGSPGNMSGRDVWNPPPVPEPRTVNDCAANEGALLHVTDGSETKTPRRTVDVATHDVDDLVGQKEETETSADQESGNGDHLDAGGESVPRHVYESDLGELERKYGKYKRKTIRLTDTISSLEREVKRLRVELHRAHLGSQLRVPDEVVDENTVTF